MPTGQSSRRSTRRCQSGASPVSIQGLPEDRVAEHPLGLVRALRGFLVPRDVGPALPARRRIERREMKPHRPRIVGFSRRPPFAGGQHRRLVVLRNGRVTGIAMVCRRLRFALLPAQPFELEPMHLPAMRARHEESALVARLVFAFDSAHATDRGRRDQEDLAPMGEGQRPRLGEPDRVAFLVGRSRIGVDLVEEDVSRRHRAQSHGRVGAGQHQHAAREILGQLRVAAVARPRGPDPLPERRAFFNQRIDPLT